MDPLAGTWSYNYVSYFFSKYHSWFVHLGYPRLDIIEYSDGEWAIIECETTPVIPALTKWKVVLSGLRNIEKTYAFVKKYVKQISPLEQQFWDRENAVTAEVDREHEAKERHALDSVDRAAAAITQNPDLMGRIARNGTQEMNLLNIRKNIPNQRMGGNIL